MRTLWQDLRYGMRMLWKSPGFLAAAVLCLGLGIGATTVVFSIVNAMLLRPLPYHEPERLMAVNEFQTRQGYDTEVSYPNFIDWRKQSSVFEGIAVYDDRDLALTGEGEPERIDGQTVSANLFNVLGVRPILGRTFTPEDEKPGASLVVLMGHRLWQRRFQSNPDIVNRTIELNGRTYAVAGVMPEEFRFPEWSELWVPTAFEVNEAFRGDHSFECVARLKAGVSPKQAQSEMTTIARRLEQQYPSNANWGVIVQPFREAKVGEIRPVLYIFIGAVLFVLLIACANIANLLLARGISRGKEIAIRTALGASRGRIVRQLLTESVIIGLAGGGLGVLLALWGLDLVLAAIPIELPFWIRFDIDGGVLLFTLLVSMLTGVIFGLAPALQVSKPDLNEMLKEGGGRGSTGGARRNRLRGALVVSEIALSLLLLIGATLMIQSFLRMQSAEPGLDPRNVLTMQLSLPDTKYADEQKRTAFFTDALERIEALPEVSAAAAASSVPLGDSYSSTGYALEGETYAPGEGPDAGYSVVTPNYFRTIGLSLKSGRAFAREDTNERTGVVIVNETLVRRHFKTGEDPLGRRLRVGIDGEGQWRTIVGVAPDVKQRRLDEKPLAQVYLPYAQKPFSWMTIMTRTKTADPLSMTAPVRAAVHSVDRGLPLYDIMSMDEVVLRSMWMPRLYGMLLGTFALVALVLAAVGIYGVMSYSVTQRTHELGIRMALGAQRSDVLRLVIRQGMLLATVGVGIGLIASFVVMSVLSNLLYGVSAYDPATFAGLSFTLAATALLACYVPARKATRVDPMVALRYE
ncbi:MAG TPA: ABC transporter permease [Pyrinomonadaceae bacterium]|jgi:putative ABC transport system permease protein